MPVHHVCPYCGKPFSAPKSTNRVYCSRTCAYSAIRLKPSAAKTVTIICAHCKEAKEILAKRSGPKIFCSGACYSAARKAQATHSCANCGNAFYRKNAGATPPKYCSESCQAIGRQKRAVVTCAVCGKVSEQSQVHAKRARYCSKTCMIKAQTTSIEIRCYFCHTGFMVIQGRADTARFCSRRCKVHYNGETTPERSIRLALDTLHVQYLQEKSFGDGKSNYSVDFYLPKMNIALEADGVYWHQERQEHDTKRDAALLKQGIRTVRITDKEINAAPSTVSLVAERLGIKWAGQMALMF